MDYQRFITELPSLYHNWGSESVSPKSEQFQAVLSQVEGMTTPNVTQLLNFAVACLESGEVYCEVGCFRGATLIGALLNHPDCMAYAVDNFSEFDPLGKNQEKLMQNLASFNLEEQVFFCNQDFEAFFADLRELQSSDRIGVYLYDGAHDYRSQLMGLLLVRPFLADRALIIVDDSNWDGVQQANWDFIATHPQCDLLLDLPTPGNGHPSFWNGLQLLSWDTQTTHHYGWSTLVQKRKIRLMQAIYDIPPLAQSPLPSNLEILQEAQHLQAKGQIIEAARAYQTAIALDANLIEGYNHLGNLVAEHGDPQQAERIYQKALSIDPQNLDVYLNLGDILLVQKKIEAAIAAYEAALQLNPAENRAYQGLELAHELLQDEAKACIFAGDRLYERKRYQEAARQYQKLLELEKADLHSYIALANCYEQMQQYEAAIAVCQQGLVNYPTTPHLHEQLIRALRETNQTEAAITQATQAAQTFPNHFYFKLQQHLLLPLLYQTPEEIQFYRDRFTQGLSTLIQEWSLPFPPAFPPSPSDSLNSLKNALAQHTNFLLAYQNANDVELQKQYGQFVHQTMAALYPEWAKSLHPNPRPKIRVGYLSACLWEHTVGKLMIGWLKHHNREWFEIYSYSLADKNDSLNHQFRHYSDVFHQIPNDFAALGQQILADQLDILVFFDLGLHPLMTQLAALRLAPVQCTTWAHPVTSGLPAVDYFLSSDLMEPDNAQEHYSEQLIRLPNIGISFARPEVPPLTKSRSDFQLNEEAVVYLTSQLLCKYLPQQDRVLAAIAQQVPNAQFVFIARPNATIARQFQQRLKRAFAAVGLDSDRHCIMLPPLNQTDYWNLNQVADVFLDSFGWSGGHTTLEAIACNLPVVTCPGEFMRGRHSYAILKMLGITETIAQTEAEYIEIAVRLGQNSGWRADLIRRMGDRHPNLYDDKTCVTALENFYQKAINSLE
ncbi:MAG: tetratricopeptide repeat protein [Leptolyngbyaceae cyanobacterium HOT.MB2.61]|jgi:protein O-GlcNAc transferase|nr:tetratricopeptide repeat protein [Leptolyngbyaceae cyanobacterium HOT.MB2.61]